MIYGTLANVSIGRLLVAGIIPGVVIILSQMIFTYFVARKNNYPRYERASLAEIGASIKQGGPAILFPVIIVGGILLGMFSPTEAAAVAVLYGLVLGLLYRKMTFREFGKVLVNVGLGSSRIMLIIAASAAFSWVMVRENVPQSIGMGISTISHEPLIVLLIVLAVLVLVGLFMVASSAEIVLTPILVPVVMQFGIDPVHFGVLMVFTLIIGGATPPVGILMFIAQDIAKISHAQMVRAMIPFYIPLFAAVLLLAAFPQITLFLPNLVFGN